MEREANPFGVTRTKRYVSSGGESEIYRTYSIVQHGTIELVDYMGGDATVERAATAGHGREIFPEQPEQSEFLQYLIARGIYEPFKSVQLKFCMQTPIETALTLVYEPSVSVNEYSGRYSVMIDTSRTPSLKEISSILTGENIPKRAEKIHALLVAGRSEAYDSYKKLINLDMARELARIGLGIDNDTRFFWKIDLFSLAQFVSKQRKLLNPQNHTSEYIETLAYIADKVSPASWRALTGNSTERQLLTLPNDDIIVDSPLNAPAWPTQETKRVVVPALETKLFEREFFLNNGEFQVVDYMGDDSAFAQAARTSYGTGTKTIQDDKNLVRSLIRDLHTSPIEMSELAFEDKVPAFIDPRQAGRHRTLDNHGFMGYTPLGSQWYKIPESEFKYQDRKNRQGRGKEMDAEDKTQAQQLLTANLEAECLRALELRAIDAPENLVRLAKGVGFYTKRWRTGDTHNLSHFLKLRLDPHAQKEIRDYAHLIAKAVEAHTPIAYQAIQDYIIQSMRLSVKEQNLIGNMIKQGILTSDMDIEKLDNYQGAGFISAIDKTDLTKGKQLTREGETFKLKLKKILN